MTSSLIVLIHKVSRDEYRRQDDEMMSLNVRHDVHSLSF